MARFRMWTRPPTCPLSAAGLARWYARQAAWRCDALGAGGRPHTGRAAFRLARLRRRRRAGLLWLMVQLRRR
jgi:hypothetical protein